MKSKTSILCVIVMLIAFLSFAFCAGFNAEYVVYAASPVDGEDGVYSVPVDLSGLSMGKGEFSSMATVEKSGDNYYLTFGHSSAVSDLQLNCGGLKAGSETMSDGGWTYTVYTVSKERLSESLNFSAYIAAMKMSVDFSVSLELENAERTGDYDNASERPAEYVPQIVCESGSDFVQEKGTAFTVPQISASLGENDCVITNELFYGGEKISENVSRFNLSNAGYYTVVFKATDAGSRYKTNFGNDSFSTFTITVKSQLGATTLVKYETDGALPQGTVLQASEVTEGSAFETAKSAISSVADNFCVIDVQFFDENGASVAPSEPVTLRIQPASTFDRLETAVYSMSDDGTLTKIDCTPYGRYVELKSDHVGIFIVCVPGVEFVMPMWGYLLVCIGAALIVAAVIAVVIITVRKKKKSS